MSLSLTELLDVSAIQSQSVSGSDFFNPLTLAQKLGYSFLGNWALYSVGADEMVFDLMKQAGVPDMAAAPASATVLGAGANLLGGEIRRVVAGVTGM